MAKLNQVLAVEKGVKTKQEKFINTLYHTLQKEDLFLGISKEYQKINDEGEDLPPESKKVQFKVEDILKLVKHNFVEILNISARKDWTNTSAKANIEVDGKVVFENVPVTYLMALEHKLVDIQTILSKLPVLTTSADWKRDEASGLYKTETVKTHRTKKIERPLVLYPATVEHPAQTQKITEDVLVGYWSATYQSGAIPSPVKAEYLERVDKLLKAVKVAREEANMQDEIVAPKVGEEIFNYILGA